MDDAQNQAPTAAQPESTQSAAPAQSGSDWKKGCLIMAAPVIGLVLILTAWAIISFIAGALSTGPNASNLGTALRVVNVGLGFFGILAIIGIPVCVIIGLVVIASPKK